MKWDIFCCCCSGQKAASQKGCIKQQQQRNVRGQVQPKGVASRSVYLRRVHARRCQHHSRARPPDSESADVRKGGHLADAARRGGREVGRKIFGSRERKNWPGKKARRCKNSLEKTNWGQFVTLHLLIWNEIAREIFFVVVVQVKKPPVKKDASLYNKIIFLFVELFIQSCQPFYYSEMF